MKKTGIWMDIQKAHIVTMENGDESFHTIFSEIELFNRKGTSGPRVKWGGNQDVRHERTYLEREKHQMREYFTKLADVVKNADLIVLFGPADTHAKFRKELNKNHKDIAAKLTTVKKADSMTDNQVKALVRRYFDNTK